MAAFYWSHNNIDVTVANWSNVFVNNEQGSDLNKEWRYIKFEVGPGTQREIPSNVKFLAMGAVVNNPTASATYQFCEFRVVELIV